MFKGAGTALITPFKQDQSVDLDSLKKIVQHQLKGEIDALIVLGTTGETPVIDYDERRKLISVVVEEATGKVPVIVGTGTNNTKKVIENNMQAEDLKADGLLIVNPYYNKGTQESLVEHYKTISEKTHLPIIVYNVPSRTGMNIMLLPTGKWEEICVQHLITIAYNDDAVDVVTVFLYFLQHIGQHGRLNPLSLRGRLAPSLCRVIR